MLQEFGCVVVSVVHYTVANGDTVGWALKTRRPTQTHPHTQISVGLRDSRGGLC